MLPLGQHCVLELPPLEPEPVTGRLQDKEKHTSLAQGVPRDQGTQLPVSF